MRTIEIQLLPGETAVTVLVKAAPVVQVPAPVVKPRPLPAPVELPEANEQQRAAQYASEIADVLNCFQLGKEGSTLKKLITAAKRRVRGKGYQFPKGDPVIDRWRLINAFHAKRPDKETTLANLSEIARHAAVLGDSEMAAEVARLIELTTQQLPNGNN